VPRWKGRHHLTEEEESAMNIKVTARFLPKDATSVVVKISIHLSVIEAKSSTQTYFLPLEKVLSLPSTRP
jgi:hypothetical protein